MKCDKCGKGIDTIDKDSKAYVPACEVRMEHFEGDVFIPDEDMGHYCSACLSERT